MGKVIYLTGAPAVGKSSTTRILQEQCKDILVWEYGERLTEHIEARLQVNIQQSSLREKSASIVTPQDVEEVDRALLCFVAEARKANHVLIDSHPVTKEVYGFRITAFSADQVRELRPNEIWILYASPEVTVKRIASEPSGRPQVSLAEAKMHAELQSAVAATYGIICGCPVYLFDTNGDREDIISRLLARLSR